MKKDIFFNVEFEYVLTDSITIPLTANVRLTHSLPHYVISNFHFKNNSSGKPLLDDINILAIKTNKGTDWVHVDSRKQTVLSEAIGKAIEQKNMVEWADTRS